MQESLIINGKSSKINSKNVDLTESKVSTKDSKSDTNKISSKSDTTNHFLFLGDCTELDYDLPSIELLVTSPPYFNSPFDYKDVYNSYEEFLKLIKNFGKNYYSKLEKGAVLAINIDDMLVKGKKYPIISDFIKIFTNIGYTLKGRIVWKKPDGYVRISRRSGVFIQHPYPMYYYPDNLIESILIFQKTSIKESEVKRIVSFEDIWEMTNVLPMKGRLETKIAAFPDELPRKLILAFSKENSVVCDPFLGSGTTMKSARELKRNSIGIEKITELEEIIRKKTGFLLKKSQNNLGDRLYVQKINSNNPNRDSQDKKFASNLSLLPMASNTKKKNMNDYLFHLIILDFRNTSNRKLNLKLKETLDNLHLGRILIVFYDPLEGIQNKITLNEILDFLMSQGVRMRDKITVRHKSERQWTIHTNYQTKVVFTNHYYEVFIFQKGKFNYKSKTREEKIECTIDKTQFQREKWYLSIWDFKAELKEACDQKVIQRLVELFLYNNETILSNLIQIDCPKRMFNYQKLEL